MFEGRVIGAACVIGVMDVSRKGCAGVFTVRCLRVCKGCDFRTVSRDQHLLTLVG